MSASYRLSLFYGAFFLAGGVQLPFWPVWLASRGLGPAEIGALLAIGQWVKVAASPLTGGLADRSGDPRRFMLLLAVVCVAGYMLCIPAHGFAALTLLNALTAACLASILPIGEALALSFATGGKLQYGRVRMWGTLSFILTTLLGGRVLTGRGPDTILYLIIGLTAFNLLSCSLLPRASTHLHDAQPGAWRRLLNPRNFVFLSMLTLNAASHSVYYAFGSIHWQSQGFSDIAIAWLWAEGAMAEAVLFYFGAKAVERLGLVPLLALGAACGAVRWTVLAFTASLPLLVLAQLLHAGTVAAVGLGGMAYLSRALPPRYAATGQAICAATNSAIGYGVFMLVAGALYGAFGGLAYLAMAGLSVLAAALALLLGRLLAATNS
ncbi:MAG TPA: MFS transporter [Stellaceae bacterium]|nr:MFS transporter [Stellaceae bacterium]